MRVISRSRLRLFWESRQSDAEIAKRALLAWEKLTRGASWAHWGDLKQTFGSADRVGNCTVFDVGNNRFRLIARVIFDKGRVFVLKVMDHEEYDRKDSKNPGRSRWEEECGCHRSPTKPRTDRGRPAGRN